MYDSGCQTQAGIYCATTPKYHAADNHDTPSSHFKLTLCQPGLFWVFNGGREPGKQQVPIVQSLALPDRRFEPQTFRTQNI